MGLAGDVMAALTTKGLTETIKMLENIEGNTDYIIEKALTEGGGEVCDVMRNEVSKLRTSDEYAGGNGKRYAKPTDKKGLLESLGYTPVQLNGSVFDINCGWDGYNKDKTKKYPKGHANQMIANAINKGTSFLIAQPFINRTQRRAREAAINKIQDVFDEEIAKLNK